MVRYLLAGACAAILGAAAIPASARPAGPLALRSAVFVEHPATAEGGRRVEPAGELSRGQKVVLVVDWRADRPRGGFTVATPIPPALAFQRSSMEESEEVSADGGQSWGRLGILAVRDTAGVRLATPEDVTHVRWRVNGGSGGGRIAYSALVR